MKLHSEYNDNQMVVAYFKYSSSSQNEASIEQQREMVRRWAKSQGLVVVNEYEDAAKTGTNADRPSYQLMLRELPKLKPAYVAVWKNDRLARDRAELLLVKQAIRAAGARVHYIEGDLPHRLARFCAHGGGRRCIRRVLLTAALSQHPTGSALQR